MLKSAMQTCVVETLAALAYNHPHGMVPFLKVSQKRLRLIFKLLVIVH